MAHFQDDHISFSYPKNWRVQASPGPSGFIETVLIQGPAGPYAKILLIRGHEIFGHFPKEFISALKESHKELNAIPVSVQILGENADGFSFSFLAESVLWKGSIVSQKAGPHELVFLSQFPAASEGTRKGQLESLMGSLQIRSF